MSQATILVVEDDTSIVIGLREKLGTEGYNVVVAVDGEAARDCLADARPDLVILDLMLPKLDGLSVLRWLRRRDRDVPVLILSAKGREEDKVEGLRIGADDYLAKPFGLKELMARIEALLRRASGGEAPFSFGAVTVDSGRRKVFRGNEEVPLSKKELEILLYLVRNRDRIVIRDQVLDAVWGYTNRSSTERTVDFHILNLRKKLEEDPKEPRHILTRHGLGYQLKI